MDLVDQIIAVISSPQELALGLGQRLRLRRLEADLSQSGLASRAGITLSSLKRFERTGEISLERLLCLAIALGLIDSFHQLLLAEQPKTLDDVIATSPKRQRGRRR